MPVFFPVADLTYSRENIPGIQQDTLIVLPKPVNQPVQLDIPSSRSRIDLDRMQEIMERAEEREQEILAQQSVIVRPRIERIRKPSIEVDPLMMKYLHIGCNPPINFPDTLPLTVLEQYFQPIPKIILPQDILITEGYFEETLPDSIVSYAEPSAILPAPANHFLPVNPRMNSYPNAIVLFLLGTLVFFTWIKYNFGRNLKQMVLSFFSFQQARRTFEERKESDKQAALYTNIFSYVITGIFISLVFPKLGFSLPWEGYTVPILFFSVAIALLYAINAIIWKIFGTIFLIQPVSMEYIYTLYLYNRNTGIFIFPLVAIMPFVPYVVLHPLIYTIIAIICLVYLLRVFRFFQIIRSKNASFFYFILYLCTLEILPFLIFAKTCKMLIDF
ncbi:MAG: DUF4271 domain-containing protein [Bacteroidales bacterium]|jgi:hypothetical protein|nr:DUF4271 domain-containing protein [Bacteroidales bacterium]